MENIKIYFKKQPKKTEKLQKKYENFLLWTLIVGNLLLSTYPEWSLREVSWNLTIMLIIERFSPLANDVKVFSRSYWDEFFWRVLVETQCRISEMLSLCTEGAALRDFWLSVTLEISWKIFQISLHGGRLKFLVTRLLSTWCQWGEPTLLDVLRKKGPEQLLTNMGHKMTQEVPEINPEWNLKSLHGNCLYWRIEQISVGIPRKFWKKFVQKFLKMIAHFFQVFIFFFFRFLEDFEEKCSYFWTQQSWMNILQMLYQNYFEKQHIKILKNSQKKIWKHNRSFLVFFFLFEICSFEQFLNDLLEKWPKILQ